MLSKNAWYGWGPDRPDHRDHIYAAKKRRTLPVSVDLRAGCSLVDNQAACGSCTAHALVGALEYLEKMTDRTPTDLSRLFVYYNERAMEGTVEVDAGARLRDGIKVLAKQGVCSEKAWPYKIKSFATRPPAACYAEAKAHLISSYSRITTLAGMRACLAEGYPFVFGFSVFESFESDAVALNGKVPMPEKGEKMLGGHAVMAVGYDDRKKHLLVRNSWGADWGIGGYFELPYGYVDDKGDSIADDFWVIRTFEEL